jgi:AbrB family looped-hinge helix DNA binding protein
VGPKGQVVIPKALRDELGIAPGDEVAFSIEDGAVLVEPVKEWRSLKGILKGKGLVAELEAEHRWEIERGR